MTFFYLKTASFFRPARLVYLAGAAPGPSETPSDTSAFFDDADVPALAAVRDVLPADAAAAVDAAEKREAQPAGPERSKDVPLPVLELTEAGLLKETCTTADLQAILDDKALKLTPPQRGFLESVVRGGDAGIATLNKQLEAYQEARKKFSVERMREIITRSQENLLEQGYSIAKDLTKKGLDVLRKGVDTHPVGMLVAAGVLLWVLWSKKDKIGSFWKWGLGLTAAAVIAPMAVDAVRGAGMPGVGPRDAAEKQAKEKEEKIAFLTGNLPASFVQNLRARTATAGLPGDQGLLGFYELCNMSVAQFVDEMLKHDENITEADIGVNLGDQTYTISGKQRYALGKKLLRTFGFDPDSTADLQAFRARFSKDQKKLWMVAKVFPIPRGPEQAAA